MDWTHEIKDDLRSYSARKASIQNTSDELERLQAELYGIKSAMTDGTPVSGGTNRREDRLLNLIVKKGKLEGAQKCTRDWVRIMDRALAELSTEEFELLDKLYIHGAKGSADRLAESGWKQLLFWNNRRDVRKHYSFHWRKDLRV